MKNVCLICMMAVSLTISNVFIAYSQDTSAQPIVTEDCIMNISISQQLLKNKQFTEAFRTWSTVYDDCPNANKAIYTTGAKIIEALFREASDEVEKRSLAELAIEIQDKRIEYFGNDPKYPTAYILGEKGLAYLDYWGDEKIEEAHECLQQSVQQRGDKSKVMVLVKLVDASYEMYKMNPGLYEAEFLADYHLARNYLEKLATDPSNKNAETAKEQIQHVDSIFENSGISQ